jgi:ribonuclease J
LWEKLKCPIYTTEFTAEILRRKLIEAGIEKKVNITVVESGQHISIGKFGVEWIRLTHSIPDPYSLMITTSAGKVFHTGDWKLDHEPVIGDGYDQVRYQQLADEDIDAMICDSTNATVQGHSETEASLYNGLKQHVESAKGRVVIACFGSNVARLHTIARIAQDTNRHLGLLGRSLINMMSAAKVTGRWQYGQSIVDPKYLSYLPADTVLIVATGSQGEPRTALNRLSMNDFRDLQLEPNDTVIFSSKMIPGNELAIEALIDRLKGLKVNVITPENSRVAIHASGHPAAEELKQMYRWVSPQCAIPVHGEIQHLKANAAISKAVGVNKQLLGQNGDLYFIAPVKGIRRRAVKTGRLGLERGKLIKID